MAFIKKQSNVTSLQADTEMPLDCASLALALSQESAEARRRAARELIHCPGAASALLAQLSVEPSLSVREVILTTLIRLGDPQAILGLSEFLRSEDASIRNEALEAMKQLPDSVATIMRDLLLDADADVRIFAVNIMETLRHPDVESWLIQVIQNDAHVNVCATALDLLSEVGTDAALAALIQINSRFPNEPYIQFAADLAIKRIQES
jgi:HEAT repeat protein